jgi:uncharacterized repeat protein (TIGR01451 family)
MLRGMAALVAALLLAGVTSGPARALDPRVTFDGPGDLVLTGNGVLDCDSADRNCLAAQSRFPRDGVDNDDFALRYVDVDGDPATFNSSEAGVVLPADGRVEWAGLYWGGRSAAGTGGADPPDAGARDRVLLRTPGRPGYQAITADELDPGTSQRFQAFAEVTDLVRAAGGGTYGVGDVQVGTGRDDVQSGGWALVVVYADRTAPVRNVVVFDGFALVRARGVLDQIQDEGVFTPATGPVRATVGVVAQDGDTAQGGDALELAGAGAGGGGAFVGEALENRANPRDNVLNGTLTRGASGPAEPGFQLPGLNPDLFNAFGWDVDVFDTVDVLAPQTSRARVRLSTARDEFAAGVVTLATEVAAPRLQATKTVDRATAQFGDTLEYTITITNASSLRAASPSLFDSLPPGATYVPDSLRVEGASAFTTTGRTFVQAGLSDLAGGATVTVTFRVQVGPGSGPVLANQADLTFGAPGPLPRYRTDTPAAVTTIARPDLSMDKSHPAPLVAGGTGRFDLVVANAGAGRSVGPVTVRDALPDDFTLTTAPSGTGWDCSASTDRIVTCRRDEALAAGASFAPVAVPVRLSPSTPPGAITNTATVANASDPEAANDADDDVVEVPAPQIDLAVTKTLRDAAPAAGFAPGDPVVWRVDVTNRGPSDARGATLTETLPAPLTFAAPSGVPAAQTCQSATCDLGTLAPGATVTRYVGAALPSDPAAFPSAASLSNRVSVSATGDERDGADNARESAIRTVGLSDAFVEKSFAPARPAAGGPVTYTLRIGTNGPEAADLAASDTLPAALEDARVDGAGCALVGRELTCSLTGVAPGADRTVTVSGTLAAGNAGATVRNDAHVDVAAPTIDVVPSDDDASAAFVPGRVDLVLSKTRTGGPGPVPAGGEAVFDLVVRNAGDATATGVTVTDPLPAGLEPGALAPGCAVAGTVVTCAAGSLQPGGEAAFAVRAVAQAAAVGQTVVNRATVAAEAPDATPGDDVAEADVQIAAPPLGAPAPVGLAPPTTSGAPGAPGRSADLAVEATAPRGPLTVGETARLGMRVTNRGPDAATGVTLETSRRDLAARAAAAGCPAAACALGALGTLAPGATRTVRLALAARRAGRITVSAHVRAAEPDPVPGNGAAMASVRVLGPVALRLSGSASPPVVRSGRSLRLRLGVAVRGRRAARDVRVCTMLPRGLRADGGGRRACFRFARVGSGAGRRLRLRVEAARVRRPRLRTVRIVARGANTSGVRAVVTVRVRPSGEQGARFTG